MNVAVTEAKAEETAPSLTISDRAVRQIARLIAEEGGGCMFRISVSGGGCSGFQYGFSLDDTRGEDDLVFEREGAKVLVDTVSLAYLAGSELDYVEDLIGASFQMRNPNATSSCGCGTSFSI